MWILYGLAFFALYLFFMWSNREAREKPRRQAETVARKQRQLAIETAQQENNKRFMESSRVYNQLPETEKAAWLEKDKADHPEDYRRIFTPPITASSASLRQSQ